MSIIKGSSKNLRSDDESALYPPDLRIAMSDIRIQKEGFIYQSIADKFERISVSSNVIKGNYVSYLTRNDDNESSDPLYGETD